MEAQNSMEVRKTETSEEANPKPVHEYDTLYEPKEIPDSDSPITGNIEAQNSMKAVKAEALEDADTELVHECNAPGELKAEPDSDSPTGNFV